VACVKLFVIVCWRTDLSEAQMADYVASNADRCRYCRTSSSGSGGADQRRVTFASFVEYIDGGAAAAVADADDFDDITVASPGLRTFSSRR